MKVTKIMSLVLCLLFALMFSSCDDHFKVYIAKSLEGGKEFEVTLKDQFDKEPRRVMVSAIKFFANPVSKNGGKIYDRNAHLTWYRIEDPSPKRWEVKFSNQFGKQQWKLGVPVYLLVPTEKIEPGSARPKKLDHFKGYEVLSGEPLNIKVTLEDQFDKQLKQKEVAIVAKPMFFCNPVHKNNEVVNKSENHLACYLITQSDTNFSPRDVTIRNQFGTHNLTVEKSYMLCVPTKKLSFKEIK
ncbi:MAG: hypothetical protein JSW07_03775 [bacterium]|nr:MAG: hypothetical protein JSW07_03775 [bacterium]